MTFFRALPVALAAVAVFATPASAAETRKFDAASFAAAQAQGRPILVDVKAWWCPVCASQGRTIKAAITDPKYAPLVIFEINYDTQKAEWKRQNVRKQSTLIAYRGARELGRIEYETDKEKINALLASTVR